MTNLNITFKNVHQGDAILLEWTSDIGERELGIIDCSLCSLYTNPILNSLKENRDKKVKFLVLTHPHTDHYSGLTEILHYLYTNNIEIEYFIHSSQFHIDSLKEILVDKYEFKDTEDFYNVVSMSVHTKREKENLKYIYKTLIGHELNIVSQRIFKKIINISSQVIPLQLNSNIELDFISPLYSTEIKRYIKRLSTHDEKHLLNLGVENNPDANLLSIVTLLKVSNKYILLSSDAVKSTFSRLTDVEVNRLPYSLCQLPHHGSKYNFHEPFWLPFKDEKNVSQFVISAGEKYGHPQKSIVEFFTKCNKLHCTNNVNGFKEFADQTDDTKIEEVAREFDSFHPYHNLDIEFGDKEFVLDKEGNLEN